MNMPIKSLVVASAPIDIEEFLGQGWKTMEDVQDKESLKLTEVDFSRVELVNCLHGQETHIKGHEKLSRLKKEQGRVLYGTTVFMGLWQDYKNRGPDSVLEKLRIERNIDYIDFFGDVVYRPGGPSCVLGLLYNDYSCVWDTHCYSLDEDWIAQDYSAISGSI